VGDATAEADRGDSNNSENLKIFHRNIFLQRLIMRYPAQAVHTLNHSPAIEERYCKRLLTGVKIAPRGEFCHDAEYPFPLFFGPPAGSFCALLNPRSRPVHHDSSTSYVWKNVRIVAGGFITGIEAHPWMPELFYVRTDIGGSYRWESIHADLDPITDWVTPEQLRHQGTDQIRP